MKPDGDPNFPGGIGCEQCDTLWATSDSLSAHTAEDHPVPTLAYGHHRLLPTRETIVGWGARCIFSEVMDGGQGVVWDRQDGFGPKELFDALLSPAIDGWFRQARVKWRTWDSGSDDILAEDLLLEREGTYYRVVIKGSPQGSYGYLYVTALLSEYEEEATPTCDICGQPEDQDPTNGREYDWNGETGNHKTCEEDK